MKKSRLFAAAALLSVLAMHVGGCNGEWGERGTSLETRTFALHHIEASVAANLIGPYIYAERAGAPGMVSEAQDDSPAITVRETADNLARIAAVLAEFDRPADRTRTLALKFQLISPNGSEPDPEISDVVAELKRFLRFDGYSLAGEAYVSLASGQFQQRIRTEEATYDIDGFYRPKTRTLRISLFGRRDAGRFGTEVVINPGKTLVLGTVIGHDATTILVVRSLVTDQVDADRAEA